MSGKNDIDKAGKVGDNENKISDKQKQQLFDAIEKTIDAYIVEKQKAGKDIDSITAELVSENSSHRAGNLGRLKAKLRDLRNRINDKAAQRDLISKIYHTNNLSDKQVEWIFAKMISDMKEVVDYAGVLYREIAIDRQTNNGRRNRVRDFYSAERQRASRGKGIAGESVVNNATEKHSEKGAFF